MSVEDMTVYVFCLCVWVCVCMCAMCVHVRVCTCKGGGGVHECVNVCISTPKELLVFRNVKFHVYSALPVGQFCWERTTLRLHVSQMYIFTFANDAWSESVVLTSRLRRLGTFH